MKILICGDYCPQNRVAESFEHDDYSSVLSEARSLTAKADYSIVNFECPITRGGENPIQKVGPNLQCSEKGMEAIKWSGFDCVTLANNHFYDYGDEGVACTLEVCRRLGIDTVGGSINIFEASKVLYKQLESKYLAIINCCEHEFSIATEKTGGANPLNPIQQYYAIKEAKQKADYVLVIMHGGHEHWQLPSERMVETYRFFVDSGADAVINHHQHCYSGYEVYHGKPIFYGLGNFCFDKTSIHNGKWTEGYAVTLDFSDHELSFEIQPYRQCSKKPRVELLEPSSYDTRLMELNAIIKDPQILARELNKYYDLNTGIHSNIFEPIYNRYYLAAKEHGWVPSLISKRRKINAANYVLCESHRDVLIHWLLAL